MKYMIFLFALIFSKSLIGQELADGENILTDGQGFTLILDICDGEWGVCDMMIIDGKRLVASGGQGEWFRVNMNGVDEDYDGPEGWYQFESNEGEYYELELVNEKNYKLSGNRSYNLTLIKR